MKKFFSILLLLTIVFGNTATIVSAKDESQSSNSSTSEKVSQSSSTKSKEAKETTSSSSTKESSENKENSDLDSKDEKETKGRWDEETPTNFNINDWTYELRTVVNEGSSDNGNTGTKQVIVLKKYNGSLKNIEIPGLYKIGSEKREVWLDDTNNGENILPNDVETVKFVSQSFGSAKVWAFNTCSLFKNKTKLKSVDLDGLELLKVTSMAEMFKNCSSLESVDLSFKGTYNVTSMAEMFYGCSSLKSVNLEFMETQKLTNISKMFYGCSSLYWLDLSNFDLSHVKQMELPFFTEEKTPFLVLSGNNNYTKLKNVNYDANNRIVPGPWFDPNGGTFDGKSDVISYFTSCVIKTQDELALSKLKEKFNSLHPENNGLKFKGWTVEGANPQNPSSILDYLETTFKVEWEVVKPNTSEDNTVFDPQAGKLSFAYVPTKFEISTPQKLVDSGVKEYPFEKQNTFNLGVYYLSKAKMWNVQTYLQWNGTAIPEAVVQTYGTKVMINKNNGTQYNPVTDLVAQSSNYVQGSKNLEINTDAQIIMENTSLSAPQGTYDLELGNVSLKLKDASLVAPGPYSANVVWNLVQAPS